MQYKFPTIRFAAYRINITLSNSIFVIITEITKNRTYIFACILAKVHASAIYEMLLLKKAKGSL